MSLNIYLDECANHRTLCDLLVDAGHDVQTPLDVDPPLLKAKDEVQFAHAQETERTLLTFNPRDFLELHNQDANHSGVFVVYKDNDKTRDMTYQEMVDAIANLISIEGDMTGKFRSLNAYNW